MTEQELFNRLTERPALRHAVARNAAESAAARVQYRSEAGYEEPEQGSLIATKAVRAELLGLLKELGQ